MHLPVALVVTYQPCVESLMRRIPLMINSMIADDEHRHQTVSHDMFVYICRRGYSQGDCKVCYYKSPCFSRP